MEYYRNNPFGGFQMQIPAEQLIETVLSELKCETFKDNHTEDDCQICAFSKVVNEANNKASKAEDMYPLDRMMKAFLEAHCGILPILALSGELTNIIWMARICFITGLKVGRMESQLSNLENLIK